ncbi:MAG TPA: hypothetical protein PK295_00810 [Candidatus Magasanikbacteria bacterium]|nr:hypothetical protein [Candidatus Magasanikbacteria bacterium]
MEVKKFLIAGGNSTALVYNSKNTEKDRIIHELLTHVEQIGFISTDTTVPTLTMMGDELCINSILAFASTLDEQGVLYSSGSSNPIYYSNKNNIATAEISLTCSQQENIVLFDGIGFILHDAKKGHDITKQTLSKLCETYNLPAFGGIIYDNDSIEPYIYVAAIHSFVKETACGSGSLAFSLFSGITEVTQPSGEKIIINTGEKYRISAPIIDYV